MQLTPWHVYLKICANHPAIYDDVIKWRHFPRYWPCVLEIHRSPVNSTRKGQWRGALMFSLICAWSNRWANNGENWDLRRLCGHYQVIVMSSSDCDVRRCVIGCIANFPDSKVHGANMEPTWVLSVPAGPMLAPWTLTIGLVWGSKARYLTMCCGFTSGVKHKRNMTSIISIMPAAWRTPVRNQNSIVNFLDTYVNK